MGLNTAAPSYTAGNILTAAQLNALQDGIQSAWTAYTPTFTNLTVGNATVAGRYLRIGKTIQFAVNVTIGSTTAYGAGWLMTLPVAPLASEARRFAVGMQDLSANTHWVGTTFAQVGSSISLGSSPNASGQITSGLTSTVPFTWATGDVLTVHGTYEAA